MEQIMQNKKFLILNSIITIIIVLIGWSIMFGITNKSIDNLQYSLNWQTKVLKANQKHSDMSTFENQLIDTIEWASKSVVSIIISKNIKFYMEDPSSMIWPGNIQEQIAKIGGGSGIIVSKDWYIITNKHVVEDTTSKYSVILNDWTTYNVDKIWLDDMLDIAILKIIDDDSQAVTDLPEANIISMEDEVKIGQFAIAIGNSLSEFRNSVTMGIISARNRQLKINKNNLYVWLYQTDAPINAGNSWGPLLDIYGNIIWINTAISNMWEGVAFALPITNEFVIATIESVQRYNKISRPLIGIAYVDINNDNKSELKIDVNNGIYIKDVFSDLPAHDAGIQIWDIITAIDDKLIDQKTPFLYQLYTYSPGENITLRVIRGKDTLTIPMILGQNN